MSDTAKLPNHPRASISITRKIKAMQNIGRKRGSLTKIPAVAKPSTQGKVNKINILAIIATAPAALLGKAFNIA